MVPACQTPGPTQRSSSGRRSTGIDGRKAGTFDGYNYSDAMKGSGITWDEAVFKEYIGAPMQKVPGPAWPSAGVRDPKEVEDLWTYLKGFGTDGQKK